MNRINFGYACINTQLRKRDIFMSRTHKLETINKKGMELIIDSSMKNLDDLIKIMIWNYKHNIKILRMSSEMFPHIANPKFGFYNIHWAYPKLKEVGKIAKELGIRLTFHPDQHNHIGTPHLKVLKSTFADLFWHARIMDIMELDHNSIIIVHGGGTYKNKEETKKRWIYNFKRLPEFVQRRIVIENCERQYNIIDVLEIAETLNIPVIFDTHHHDCYNYLKNVNIDIRDYIPRILKLWKSRNIKPKFHVSEQAPDKRIGAHSDYIEKIPDYLLEIPDKYDIDIDIMLEAKMKELAVFRIREIYGI